MQVNEEHSQRLVMRFLRLEMTPQIIVKCL
jgi:hypothetical protein